MSAQCGDSARLGSRQLRCPGSQGATSDKSQVLRRPSALEQPAFCARALPSCRRSTPSVSGAAQLASSKQRGAHKVSAVPLHPAHAHRTCSATETDSTRAGQPWHLSQLPGRAVRAHESYALAWKGHAVCACESVQAHWLDLLLSLTLGAVQLTHRR